MLHCHITHADMVRQRNSSKTLELHDYKLSSPSPRKRQYMDEIESIPAGSAREAVDRAVKRMAQIRQVATGKVRTFESGATRDTEEDKHDPEGFLSPLVIERFNAYMHKNRIQKDGSFRASDNWQKGMPLDAYMKSGWRHFLDWWKHHRGVDGCAREALEDALCALMFNVMGYLNERLKSNESIKCRNTTKSTEPFFNANMESPGPFAGLSDPPPPPSASLDEKLSLDSRLEQRVGRSDYY